jgi:hypothetical protein
VAGGRLLVHGVSKMISTLYWGVGPGWDERMNIPWVYSRKFNEVVTTRPALGKYRSGLLETLQYIVLQS